MKGEEPWRGKTWLPDPIEEVFMTFLDRIETRIFRMHAWTEKKRMRP